MKSINKPEQITIQQWDNETRPVVSIACLAYNHDKYICDAIEGFLMQETTFPVEILIHDDASTDKTADIIMEYETKYPHLIKPIYQTKNQYSRGNSPARINRNRAMGKYIALCEGDDYWTDPLKLQKQANFLEENEKYSMICSNYSIVDENKEMIDLWAWKGDKTHPHITQKVILERYTPKLLTVLIRKRCLENIDPEYSNYNFPNGDVAMFSAVTKFGPCYFMNEITGCYRKNPNGIWSTKDIARQLQMRFITLKNLSLLHSNNKQVRTSIYKRLIKTCRVLFIISIKKAHVLESFVYFYYYLFYKTKLSINR